MTTPNAVTRESLWKLINAYSGSEVFDPKPREALEAAISQMVKERDEAVAAIRENSVVLSGGTSEPSLWCVQCQHRIEHLRDGVFQQLEHDPDCIVTRVSSKTEI